MTEHNTRTAPQRGAAPASADVTTGGALSRRALRRRRCLRNLLLVVAATTGVNAAIASLLITWRAPVVVSFDMKGTIDRFTEQAGAQALNEVQTKALSARFMTTLGETLHDWQQRHDALILVSPAVVSGAPDITDDIQAGVSQKMAAGE